jgi:RHS repeat-associated protein
MLSYGKDGKFLHAVTQYGQTAIDYDANGNMISKGTMAYTYDAENRLVKVEDTANSEPLTYNLQLSAGWNFFSLPIIPEDLKISTVLSSILGKYDQISRYNSTNKQFEHYVGNSKFDQFDTFEYARGYQIYITDPLGATLTITGQPSSGQTVYLKSQWNLIGANHQNKEVTDILKDIVFTRLSRYNKNTQSFEEYPSSFSRLESGQAYYLKIDQDQNWTMTNNSKPTTEFVYDQDGGRIKKQIKDEQGRIAETLYIGNLYEKRLSVTGEFSAANHIFAGSTRICSVEMNDQRQIINYYHPDHLGSSNIVTAKTDTQVNEVSLIEYTPYGSISKQIGSYDPRYKFNSKELDSSTALYYYGVRYYDYGLGRFISVDPADPDLEDPQTLNKYSYCVNNPLKYIDPTGEYEVEINEVQPGDVGLQRAGTNLISRFGFRAKDAGKPSPYYAHAIIVIEVKKNKKGEVTSIREGSLRAKPENKRTLTKNKVAYPGGIRIWDPTWIAGESMFDYDYFRVTNDPAEAKAAVGKAEHPKKWDIEMDPDVMFDLLTEFEDTSDPDDNKMLCPEYINFLYDNKFKDPKKGATLPSDIYEYQKKIERPR